MTSLPIYLPQEFEPTVQVDDEISIGQVIAKKSASPQGILSVAGMFGIPVKKVGKTLKKMPGDTIHPGDIIASRHSFFSPKEEQLVSTVEGVITRFDRGVGEIEIRVQPEDEKAGSWRSSLSSLEEEDTIISPIEGRVAMCDNEQILIETDKDVVLGTKGSGESKEGELFLVEIPEAEKREDSILFALDTQAIGKVIVSPFLTKEAIVKGIGIGVEGVIGIDIPEEHFRYLSEKHLQTPVVMVSQNQLAQLKKWVGKRVFIEGASGSILLLHR